MRKATMRQRANCAGDRTAPRRALHIALLASVCGLGAVPAHGEVRFDPMVEARQVIGYDGYSGKEFETWSELSAGFQAGFDSKRVQGHIDYQLRQRFPIVGSIDGNTRHDLLARTNAELIRDLLFFNAGGFATTVNNDLRGFVSFNPDSNNRNQNQTLNVFAEPSLRRTLFNRFDLLASYRISYTDVGDANSVDIGDIAEDPNAFFGRSLSDSYSQAATVSLSNRAQSSRLRWSLTGTANREEIDELNQLYKSYRGVLDLEFAMDRTISLLGSVGYEDITNTQDSILVNPITGDPILVDGRFVVDPRQPRRTAYDESGITFDVGVRLSPSRRTNLMVRGGRRFGGDTYSAELRYQLTPAILITGEYSESIDSFGRLLAESINGIPIRGVRVESNVTIGPGGCVIGIDPSGSGCIDGLSQSIYAATFKEKRARLSAAAKRGRLSAILSAYWSDRTYLDSEQLLTPGQRPIDPSLIGDGDVAIGTSASATYQLSGPETLEAGINLQRSKFTLSRGRSDVYLSSSARYNIELDKNISAFGLLYYGHRWSDVVRDYSEATLSVGARYSF